jgi:hypothetical protein
VIVKIAVTCVDTQGVVRTRISDFLLLNCDVPLGTENSCASGNQTLQSSPLSALRPTLNVFCTNNCVTGSFEYIVAITKDAVGLWYSTAFLHLLADVSALQLCAPKVICV